MPWRLGLNLVFLVPGETGGMEIYARELMQALREAFPDLPMTAFVNREAAETSGPWNELIPSVTVPVKARKRVEWVRGEQTLLPRLAAREGVDVLHSPASTAPAVGRFARVTTIHDLLYRKAPEAHIGLAGLGMRALVPLAARRSHRILTVSEDSRRDIVELLGVDGGKLEVIPHGVGHTARAEPTPEPELRARLELGARPLALSLSAKRAHKNLARLLEALASLPEDERPLLVLPGYPTSYEAELREQAAALGVEGDTRFPGWLSEADVEGLYHATTIVVFPSLAEGFGLPVLEAMARGVPVACSETGAVGEVADDAALLFDPLDPSAIAGAMRRLLADPVLRERLREAGRTRAAEFSWERSARSHHAAYERARRERGAGGA